MPSDLACPTRSVWQYRTVPALSALLPTLTGVSRVGLRSAPTRLLRQPSEEDSHLLRYTAPHGAQAPRGALRLIDEPTVTWRVAGEPGGVGQLIQRPDSGPKTFRPKRVNTTQGARIPLVHKGFATVWR